jgi:hypothetical protein
MATQRRKIKNRTRKNKKFRKGGVYPEFPTTVEAVVNQENKRAAAEQLGAEIRKMKKDRAAKRTKNNVENNVVNRFTKWQRNNPNNSNNSNKSNNSNVGPIPTQASSLENALTREYAPKKIK